MSRCTYPTRVRVCLRLPWRPVTVLRPCGQPGVWQVTAYGAKGPIFTAVRCPRHRCSDVQERLAALDWTEALL